ncbi:hypothetical protein [Nocardia brevicatena]|uniref:hypothetical protein n=1 Tax=Nocardia brevicatena TaxID=37327 RepID=UPI00031A11F2|nr:hypothetical protein [Nocardia brevicatena]
MYTWSASLVANLPTVASPQAFPEVDPNAVVVSSVDCDLTYPESDRRPNRLARVPLRHRDEPGTRIAISVDSPIERVMVEHAVLEIDGTPVYTDSDAPLTTGDHPAAQGSA